MSMLTEGLKARVGMLEFFRIYGGVTLCQNQRYASTCAASVKFFPSREF